MPHQHLSLSTLYNTQSFIFFPFSLKKPTMNPRLSVEQNETNTWKKYVTCMFQNFKKINNVLLIVGWYQPSSSPESDLIQLDI